MDPTTRAVIDGTILAHRNSASHHAHSSEPRHAAAHNFAADAIEAKLVQRDVPNPNYLRLNLPGSQPVIVHAEAMSAGWNCYAIQPDGRALDFAVFAVDIAARVWLWCDANGNPVPAPTPSK